MGNRRYRGFRDTGDAKDTGNTGIRGIPGYKDTGIYRDRGIQGIKWIKRIKGIQGCRGYMGNWETRDTEVSWDMVTWETGKQGIQRYRGTWKQGNRIQGIHSYSYMGHRVMRTVETNRKILSAVRKDPLLNKV